MRPVVWSHSSIDAYLDCHLRWYFTYVMCEEEEPSEARMTGIAVHDVAERILKGQSLPLLDGPCGICEMFPHSPQCPNQGAAAEGLIEVFISDILPTYRDTILIEAPFQYELDGIPVSGIIDALDEQDTEEPLGYRARILRDLKTTKSRPSAGKYRLQMTIYWLGATELGYPPHAAMLDYIVRTKKPYYWPEVVSPIDEDDVDVLSATLQALQNGVESSDYEPTGLGTPACSWCGYKAICGPYQRLQELSNPIREEAR